MRRFLSRSSLSRFLGGLLASAPAQRPTPRRARMAVEVLEDRTAPTGTLAVSLTSPVNGSFTNNDQPTLKAAASDAGGPGLASVQFQYSSDGGITWNDVGPAETSGPFSVNFPTALSNGTYEVRAIATDIDGNTASSEYSEAPVPLASFGTSDQSPQSGLIEDNNGNFFGTSSGGYTQNHKGTVFDVVAGSGAVTTLASFNGTDGQSPAGGLVEDSSGDLFGTTDIGGADGDGTVFEVAAVSGALTTLASFNSSTNGSNPQGTLVEDGNGDFFGTTTAGGTNSDGTVFELGAGSQTITPLASFNGTNGANPEAGLLEDDSGNLFGTTKNGGADGDGTVFELVAGSGTITPLASFNGTNGANPAGALVEDNEGDLFGTALSGGVNGDGTVFELVAGSGTITPLASFNGTNGQTPECTLVRDKNGNLFGTTVNGGPTFNAQNGGAGTVFEVAANSGVITTLASFNGANEGGEPADSLIEDSGGNLFGTTSGAGLNGTGTVFELVADVTFTIDTVVPTVSVTAPVNGSFTTNNEPRLTAAASDAGGPGLANIQFQDSNNGGATWQDVGTPETSGPFSFTFTSPLSPGAYQARAIATDNVGNSTTSTTVSFTVENLGNLASIVPFIGALQSATVASAFEPLQAIVTDSSGDPLSGVSVTFAEVAGANGATGSFAGNAMVTTNAYGIAIAPALTAGHTAGAFTVTASVSGVASSADFALTNTPGAPATITAVGGAAQNTPIGSPFDTALQAKVVDAFGNPLADVPVTFAAPSTGPTGTFHALTMVPTNALGIATAPAFTADHVLGSFTITATGSGIVTPATFTLTNTAIPAAIQTVTGSGQSASVTSAFRTPLEVRVTNAAGTPVVGITVNFELPGSAANGTFAGSSAVVTNASGLATAPALTANTVAGSFIVSAWVAEVRTPATFTLTNLPLGPSAVNVIAGSGQAAALGIAFAKTLQARVVDHYGNPLAGVTVTFRVPTTGASGTFAGHTTATAVTGANGIATIAITANSTPGNFQATASVALVATPATFSLTNSPIHALKVIAGSPQSATTNTAYSTALQVKAVDAAGNPLLGVSITFTAPSSGASGTFATSATVLTNASGIAIAPVFTANGVAGSFNVTASLTSPVAGVAPVTFALKNVAPSHGLRRALLPAARPIGEL